MSTRRPLICWDRFCIASKMAWLPRETRWKWSTVTAVRGSHIFNALRNAVERSIATTCTPSHQASGRAKSQSPTPCVPGRRRPPRPGRCPDQRFVVIHGSCRIHELDSEPRMNRSDRNRCSSMPSRTTGPFRSYDTKSIPHQPQRRSRCAATRACTRHRGQVADNWGHELLVRRERNMISLVACTKDRRGCRHVRRRFRTLTAKGAPLHWTDRTGWIGQDAGRPLAVTEQAPCHSAGPITAYSFLKIPYQLED